MFQKLLGKNISNDEVVQYFKSLKSEPIQRENNVSNLYDYEWLFKEDGILITVLNSIIISIKVYFSPTPICQPFRDEFVWGLSYISSENDIKKQFDFPENLNREPMRADNIYQHKNCTVAFDAMTGEINYGEIRL
ncbi:hypothetical protein [Faecalibacter sp. LW9]|uniref:hypothetical protein n=1 Tax=Faecalibacter sp. LW9 TaxID=3103144 RepID=UPI002B002AB3|nr:hypothetical protein [Faecalibacter sp. LW9]